MWLSCSSDKLKLTHFTSDSHSNIVSQSDAFVRSSDFEISLCLGYLRCGIIPSALRNRSSFHLYSSIQLLTTLLPLSSLPQPSADHTTSTEKPFLTLFLFTLLPLKILSFLILLLIPLLPLKILPRPSVVYTSSTEQPSSAFCWSHFIIWTALLSLLHFCWYNLYYNSLSQHSAFKLLYLNNSVPHPSVDHTPSTKQPSYHLFHNSQSQPSSDWTSFTNQPSSAFCLSHFFIWTAFLTLLLIKLL